MFYQKIIFSWKYLFVMPNFAAVKGCIEKEIHHESDINIIIN